MKKIILSLLLSFSLLLGQASADTLIGPGRATTNLPVGQRLTVTTAASSTALIVRNYAGALVEKVSLPASTTYVFSEYYAPMDFQINATAGQLVWAVAQNSQSALSGTATNDSANSGMIGEYLTATLATGSSVTLTTATTANVVSKALSGGDYLCSGSMNYTFGATTAYTRLAAGLSTTSATLGTQDTYSSFISAADVPTASFDLVMPVPLQRVSVASAGVTLYLVANASFTISTLKAYGTINCWRIR